MKKAIIYGRVSTDDQDYSRQLADLNKYAKRNDINVVETFTEKISGTKKDRPAFNSMLKYLNENTNVKLILVTELTRFGRMGVNTRLDIERLADKGINIYFQDRNLNSLDSSGKPNSDTMMIIGILSDIAKKEIETLKQRIKSGLQYSVSNNGAGTGVLQPYGFKNENKKRVIDNEEAKIIQLIFELYTKGLGASSIAKHLNEKQIKTRYQKVFEKEKVKTKSGIEKLGKDFSWSSGTIITILKNTIYKGERNFKGEVYKINPIIKPDTFNKVQQLLNNRNNRPIKGSINNNYLKGIIKCGVCGQPYYMHQRKDNHDSAYKCLSKKLKYDGKTKYCGSPSIGIDKLLNSIQIISYKEMFSYLKNNQSSSTNQRKKDKEVIEIKISNLKSELNKLNKKDENLIELFTDELITKKQLVEKRKDYKNQIEKVETELNEFKNQLLNINSFKELNQNDLKANKEEFKTNLRNIIKLVTISNINPITISSMKNEVNIMVDLEFINGFKIRYQLNRYDEGITADSNQIQNLKKKGY